MAAGSRSWLAVTLTLLVIAGPVPGVEAKGSLALTVGSQQVLDTPRLDRVAVGAPDIVGVRVLDAGRRVLLTGLAPGRTTLTLFHTGAAPSISTVEVLAGGQAALRREILDLLAGVEGLGVRVAGDLVLLDGALHRRSDRARVARVAALYPNARDLTVASPLLHRTAAARVNDAFAAAGLVGLRAVPTPEAVVVEGRAASPADLERARVIAQAFAEAPIFLAAAGVPDLPMIGLDVRFLEVARSSLAQVGIRWSEAVPLVATVAAAAPLGGGSAGGSAGLSASLTTTLLALMRDGRARLLANPRLVTRSGEPADFLAGGEIPIALVGERQSTFTWRPYGILLECTPEADREGRIAARILVEVSTLDRSNGIPEAPALATRRVRTAFTVRAGETIALSGLLSADASKDVQRVPGLGRIPILGELFKSRAWQHRQTELVVFVTPTLVGPAGRAAVEAARARYRRMDREVRPSIDD